MNDHDPPIHFLLVDDKEASLAALEGLLRRPGLVCLKARSGAEALDLLLEHEVALAVLDVEMPDMSGLALAELMRGAERTKHVPIVFVTAGEFRMHLFDGFDAGAVAFLQKPIEPRILKNKANTFFELFRQKRRLESTLRFHEMFVAALGHDLRNPLNSIVMAGQMLQHTVRPQDREIVTRMLASARSMTCMLDELRDLSTARMTGSIALNVRTIDLRAVAKGVVEEHAFDSAERVELSGEGDFRVEGDPTRLARAIANLVGNGLKHGERGGAVRVELVAREDEVLVRVANRGAIDPSVATTLFEPFVSTQRKRGMGLGLYIVERVAHAHAGSVACVPGEETVFMLAIPRRHAGPAVNGVSATA